MLGALLKVVAQVAKTAAKAAGKAAANAAKATAKKVGSVVKSTAKGWGDKFKSLNPFKQPAGPKRTIKQRLKDSYKRQASEQRAKSAAGGYNDDDGRANIPSELSKPVGDILVPDQQKSLGSSGFQDASDSQYNEPTFKYPSPKLSASYEGSNSNSKNTEPSDNLLRLTTPTSPMSGGTRAFGVSQDGGINTLQSVGDSEGGVNTLQKAGYSESGGSTYSTPTSAIPTPLSGVNAPLKNVSGEAPPLLRPQTTASPTYVAPTQSSSPALSYSNTTPQPDSKQRSLDIRSHTGFKHGK